MREHYIFCAGTSYILPLITNSCQTFSNNTSINRHRPFWNLLLSNFKNVFVDSQFQKFSWSMFNKQFRSPICIRASSCPFWILRYSKLWSTNKFSKREKMQTQTQTQVETQIQTDQEQRKEDLNKTPVPAITSSNIVWHELSVNIWG